MRASGANAQAGRFVDGAIGFDDDKAAAAEVERHGHRIAEHRPAHERKPPSKAFQCSECRQLRSRQVLPQWNSPLGLGVSSTLAAKHGGNSSGRARSVDQPRWLPAEAACPWHSTCIAPMIQRERRPSWVGFPVTPAVDPRVPTMEYRMSVKAYGAYAADKPLEPMDIERREPGDHDVQIDIAYCGVCHSDLHTVRSEWGGTKYPCVPGHEIVGHVTAVGAGVTAFSVGDTVGVGCLVGSCQHCHACDEGLEQYCENGFVGTYNGPTTEAPGHTLGGYSRKIVVNDRFVLKIRHPDAQLAAVAPLLCAGITTYSPLRHWNAGPGKKVGIVGIGGLGHMGIKLAHAMGAHTVAFTTSVGKRQDALDLGADEVVVSKDPE